MHASVCGLSAFTENVLLLTPFGRGEATEREMYDTIYYLFMNAGAHIFWHLHIQCKHVCSSAFSSRTNL